MGTTGVFLLELGIRKLGLRVLVESLAIGMGRRGVQVVVLLLDILAVVPLGTGEPEEPLLEDRILPVPERQTETKPAKAVAQSEQAILTPAVDATPGMVERKGIPHIPIRGVVLSDSSPLPLGEVSAPELPEALAAGVLVETEFLGRRAFGCRVHEGRRS